KAAAAFVEQASTWAAHERAIVVEHLLLRPKFPGDALFPACADGGCCTCGDEDPYSFRLTYVLPGWTTPFNRNLNMRAVAERTIQEQTPSHLVGKTCWVGNDGYLPDPCDPAIDAIAAVLASSVEQHDEACACASEIFAAFGQAFSDWFEGPAVIHHPPDVLATALGTMFDAAVALSGVSCAGAIDADMRSALHDLLVEHFVEIAHRGFQFERFEDAWCAWAEADAAIDWTAERLQETVLEV